MTNGHGQHTTSESGDSTTYATTRHGYAIHPWKLTRSGLMPDEIAASETLFTLSNGHFGMRGTLEEGEPRAVPGTYINGFYEERPLPHAESGYGFPESGETVVNVTDGKLIRLFVGDSPFDLRYGTTHSHERALDLRTGTLDRSTEWTSPNGQSVRVTSRRLVSFAHRSLAAIHYEVEALDDNVYVALYSDLLANEQNAAPSSDPRDAAVLERPLKSEASAARDQQAVLVHRTRRSKLRMAVGMDHVLEVPQGARTTIEADKDLARYTVTAQLPKGSKLRMVKYLAYGWSHRRSGPALRDQVEAALAVGKLIGWDELAAKQRAYLDDFWEHADVEIDGDPGLQQAVRISMFHVLQCSARAEGQGLGAKGLSGIGYDGHTFWDADLFALPMLTYTKPQAARDHLTWRRDTLPQARERATELGLHGAAFPWRTITGKECSGYWPAGTAAFHVNSAVADATARYVAATGDGEFDRGPGTELLTETARLWMSLGHFNTDGSFHIDGVTGPDEYTAIVDDNLYTNVMAQANFTAAAAACERNPESAAALGVTEEEVAGWRRAAAAMAIPYDEELQVHAQSEGFTRRDEWDFEGTSDDFYPLLLNFPYFQIYRKQVIKQADLVLAMQLRGDLFTPEQKARNFAYYEARTVRDSSLSAATQAVLAAETGHLELAYDYWAEVALVDLGDLHGNVDDGLHIASMGGSWQVAVSGFGGMRDHGGQVTFAPRLPKELTRLRFRIRWNGAVVEVDVRREDGTDTATYRLVEGESLSTSHHGTPVELAGEEPVRLAIPAPTGVLPVTHPARRAPTRRVPQR
ncbi:glycoside hydrolase family 65 protein [Ruania alkalisoli]|uniref:Glycoside hydrolase family 65 protein n=1 Tax=Ruania alkalisoli TaxID=2779775 RepID=A0A7M1SVS3_9MICO|nr:glycoside hydrolase family 65 protein [Ruania alkalisoli]QOR71177.1 glycoside hydrolase family 65 protein [Ruania alkalisoli]